MNSRRVNIRLGIIAQQAPLPDHGPATDRTLVPSCDGFRPRDLTVRRRGIRAMAQIAAAAASEIAEAMDIRSRSGAASFPAQPAKRAKASASTEKYKVQRKAAPSRSATPVVALVVSEGVRERGIRKQSLGISFRSSPKWAAIREDWASRISFPRLPGSCVAERIGIGACLDHAVAPDLQRRGGRTAAPFAA